jgi:hypothetical protein
MDFTNFVSREAIPALTWLGKRDWLDFGYSQDFNDRTVWTRPKKMTVDPQEQKAVPRPVWDQIDRILQNASKDVVNSFLALALSKSIAGGPKVFQPTMEDCVALENTECTMSFADYKQPYPVVIIEFPAEYKRRLAAMWNCPKGPSHVIVHHEPEKGFITVNAFFDRNNVLSHIAPARPEYKTIEDAITRNRDMPDVRNAADDFKVAELAQRLAVNFCMVMVLLGVREVGPLDREAYKKAKKLARRKDRHHKELGRKLVDSTMFKVEFIQQKIKLYEEEFIQPRQPSECGGGDEESERKSPKPHWRRGHYRQQPFGPQQSQRKLVFIKPVLVRANLFGGDTRNTEVTYKLTNREKP